MLLTREADKEYHLNRAKYLTAHSLALFRRSPRAYIERQEKKDTESFIVGRAAHKLILEGQAAYDDFLREHEIDEDQQALVAKMADAVAKNPIVAGSFVHGAAEVVVRVESYMGVPAQSKIDFVAIDYGEPLFWGFAREIVDLKTCRNIDLFADDAKKYEYIHQLAFYRVVAAIATGCKMLPCSLVAVEKQHPFRCGVWQIAEHDLEAATVENERAIDRLLDCMESNKWPVK